MRPLIKAAVVAVMLSAAPVWAHGGPGGWWNGERHYHRHWPKAHGKHYVHHRHREDTRRVVQVYRYEPYPAPSASAEPGIHVIFPDVYLPFPQ